MSVIGHACTIAYPVLDCFSTLGDLTSKRNLVGAHSKEQRALFCKFSFEAESSGNQKPHNYHQGYLSCKTSLFSFNFGLVLRGLTYSWFRATSAMPGISFGQNFFFNE